MSEQKAESGVGEGTAFERAFNRYVGNAIHMFLSLLAVVILAAAAVTAVEVLIRVFPQLWHPATNEHLLLQTLIEDILLIGIAAELGLLLLFHRTSAAIEVIIFVVARKLVAPDAATLDLLMGTAALALLLVVRFYFLPGRPK